MWGQALPLLCSAVLYAPRTGVQFISVAPLGGLGPAPVAQVTRAGQGVMGWGHRAGVPGGPRCSSLLLGAGALVLEQQGAACWTGQAEPLSNFWIVRGILTCMGGP